MNAAERFLEAFAAAAYDVELERRDTRVYHFFDSDFLGRIIFGYRDPLNHELIFTSRSRNADSAAVQKLLMGALVGRGIGAPPRMRALPPHLYEVRRAVGKPWSGDGRHSLDLTIDALGLRELLTDLLTSLENEGADDVLSHLLHHGPKIFSGIELLSGRWESRLGRVLRLGVSESSPFDEDSDALSGDAFDMLARYVGQTSDHVPQHGRVSGLRDAMALAALAAGVNRTAGAGRPADVARFYTETPRILEAWRKHADVRSLLTYEIGDSASPELGHAVDGVLRTPEYYLIRALIPDLAHRGQGSETPSAEETSRVYGIGRDLAAAAAELRKGGLSPPELSGVRIGSSTLGEYMAEVADLSSYNTAWRTLMTNVPPGLPGDLFAQLKDVLAGEKRRSDDLDKSFRKQIETLSSRTRHVAEFTETYVHLIDRLSQWSGGLRPRYGSFAEHVGLPRWGFTSADVDEQALRHLVDSYEEWLADHRTAAAGELAASRTRFVIEIAHRLGAIHSTPVIAPERLNEIVALLGFVWHLDDFTSVAQYGGELIEGIELRRSRRVGGVAADGSEADEQDELAQLGGKIENFVAAAKLSAAVVATGGSAESQADQLAGHAHALVERLAEDKRRFPTTQEARALTQAYILFTAWLSLNRTVMAYRGLEPPRIRQPALAKESLAVCTGALRESDPTSPMHAWLLNLAVYITAVARLEHPDQSSLAAELMVCRLSEGQAWSYRFDDTLSYYYYVRAARSAAEARAAGPSGSGLLDSARKDLREAQRWLDRLPEQVDTADVVAHRGLLRELEVELEQLGKVAA